MNNRKLKMHLDEFKESSLFCKQTTMTQNDYIQAIEEFIKIINRRKKLDKAIKLCESNGYRVG